MNRATEFIASRDDWLRVIAAPDLQGGWDVAVVVDGSYSTREAAEDMAAYFARWLHAVRAEALADYEQARRQLEDVSSDGQGHPGSSPGRGP